MEIWIVGGIIVALMIYASTKIKRLAENAYARETVETDDFVIVKPEGFICPVESKYAFEARSKEFGESEASEEMLRATATIVIGPASDEDSSSKSEREEDGVTIKEFCKTLNRGGNGFELKITILADHYDEFNVRVREMLESFELK
ncbi:MAG: hypothetical protein IPN69_03580 [Acidobacteria bacterium]|nr:hypothetical protein [Acidobacteriota bacterium]MBK8809797.1 hypothetical protein [Acidobacteriota bacterium]